MRLLRAYKLVGIVSFLLLGLLTISPDSKASAAATLPAGFVEELVADGLVSTPTAMEFAPDGRLFVAEDSGALRVIENGMLLPTPFLQVTTTTVGERGLLGVAFDPGFQTNGYVYVYYTNPNPLHNRVSRFTTDAINPNQALAGSELVILDEIPSEHNNHNGGAIHFGADGYLYIAVGDNFNSANSQSLGTLSGKMLRIDTAACTTTCGNVIPETNPFVNIEGAKGAIWALGLRNPFTFGVDPMDGRIYINDVGQNRWEEINAGEAGANFGWPICEGECRPPDPSLEDPIHVYRNKGSSAITGGAFYRGTQFPVEFVGDYFFADYLKGFIKRLTPGNQEIDFAEGASSPVDLKVGPDGSLYYLSLFEGAVYKITHTGIGPSGAMHVGDIALSAKQKGTLWDVTAQVPILDENGNPVIGAMVTVAWSLNPDLLETQSAPTDSMGIATFSTGRVAQSGQTVTAAVIDVASSGFAYDPEANIETSDMITIGP